MTIEKCKLKIDRIEQASMRAAICGCVLLCFAVLGLAADDSIISYPEHQNLRYYLDAAGQKHEIKSIADWEIRRGHILANMQVVMGPLPDRSKLVPLEVTTLEETKVGDGNFEVSGVRDAIAAAKPIYQLYGKPANLEANYPESEHDFPADARDVAYRFFDRHLKGQQ